MPTFSYTARDSSGQASSGLISADNITDAIQQIRAEGKYPVNVRPADGFASPSTPLPLTRHGLRISRAELIQISTQLAIMVETGVNLSEALECIARQAEKPLIRALVSDLGNQLQSGASLSEAMARHPRAFPTLYLALIRASERSGMLPRLLNRATAYLRDEQETMRRVKGALTYPAIMFAFALGTTVFLLTFVLPRFTVIYASKAAALPLPTQLLMNASDFLVNRWGVLILSVKAAIVAWYAYVRTPGGTRFWHSLQLSLPLFGKLYRKMHLARGLRMVGTMAGAGVTLMDCVQTAENLCANSHFRDLWRQVQEQIQAGKQFSEPLFRSRLVPRSIAQMISSGEKSGKLAQVMEQISGYAEQELKDQIASLTRYIEPAMIVLMGLIIGGVALALLLPVFTISKVMSH